MFCLCNIFYGWERMSIKAVIAVDFLMTNKYLIFNIILIKINVLKNNKRFFMIHRHQAHVVLLVFAGTMIGLPVAMNCAQTISNSNNLQDLGINRLALEVLNRGAQALVLAGAAEVAYLAYQFNQGRLLGALGAQARFVGHVIFPTLM